MKRAAFLLIVSSFLLASCGLGAKNIITSTGEAPTPVEEFITAAPTDTETAPIDSVTPEPGVSPTPEQTTAAEYNQLAYTAQDGNIHLLDLLTSTDTALTDDATLKLTDYAEEIVYTSLTWSSDGLLLAYQRQSGKRIDTGLEYHFSLWVFDPADGSHREVLADVQTAGFAWRPGTHELTYAQSVHEGYFTSRAELDKTKATGIWSVDVDAGSAPVELVPPTAGYTIVAPRWSGDGLIVAFNEVYAMEGTGYFAYYNLETEKYSRLEKAIGGYDLAPDGSWMVYDTQTYIASGSERIWKSNLDGSETTLVSPDYKEGYATMPRLSPNAGLAAYFKSLGLPGEPVDDKKELFVQPVTEGAAPQSFGMFDFPTSLDWMPDGESLIVTVGTWDKMELVIVNLEDGSTVKLADGSEPAARP